jgi:putative copper export protein
MSVLQGIGLFLVLAGVAEFAVFRRLAASRENIARRIVLLNANSAFNVVLGATFLIVGA